MLMTIHRRVLNEVHGSGVRGCPSRTSRYSELLQLSVPETAELRFLSLLWEFHRPHTDRYADWLVRLAVVNPHDRSSSSKSEIINAGRNAMHIFIIFDRRQSTNSSTTWRLVLDVLLRKRWKFGTNSSKQQILQQQPPVASDMRLAVTTAAFLCFVLLLVQAKKV